MKKYILTTMLLAVTTGIFANNMNTKAIDNMSVTYLESGSCTVSYTNSYGVTFRATAETCSEAFENLRDHIEA